MKKTSDTLDAIARKLCKISWAFDSISEREINDLSTSIFSAMKGINESVQIVVGPSVCTFDIVKMDNDGKVLKVRFLARRFFKKPSPMSYVLVDLIFER